MERTVELVSTPDCQQCKATERAFEKAGVEYEKRDASVDPEAAAEVNALGYFRAPVVLVKVDGKLMTHWGGFRPDNVSVLVASQKPRDVEFQALNKNLAREVPRPKTPEERTARPVDIRADHTHTRPSSGPAGASI
ncbi:glutaredoxin domain-containing protein [Pseudoclavibacter sp. Z016]|uniref:glutaredoxin domain-containing protein n=1 Tax=Pseudoclavibacter sp. Z016 TaxID=2080581 RepID=UPI000CE7AADF|nr:glutaredoxin domain-containing protein [Pseudoclavibacter sp. Z016]PPF75083.1 hypothetical protein C5B99_12325 [Pseudoclavibacter sp. Z016]